MLGPPPPNIFLRMGGGGGLTLYFSRAGIFGSGESFLQNNEFPHLKPVGFFLGQYGLSFGGGPPPNEMPPNPNFNPDRDQNHN